MSDWGNPRGGGEAKMERPSALKAGVTLVGVIVIVLFLGGVLIGACQGLNRTEPGEVKVIRNSGPFDSKDIRVTRPPESGWTISGLWSDQRSYIAADQQRFYKISTDPDQADPPATSITVPTSDGVQVSIEGTVNFHTVFTGEADDEAIREFDTRFGNREYGGKHVWEDGGWENFLQAQFRPTLISTFREEIGAIKCEQLQSSCALAQQSEGGDLTAAEIEARDSAGDFQKVATAVQEKLETRMDAALGGHFLEGYEVQIEVVTLPESVQEKINTVQTAFADVTEQQARAEAAKYEAERIRVASQALDEPGALALEIAKLYSANCDQATCVIDATGKGLGLNIGK